MVKTGLNDRLIGEYPVTLDDAGRISLPKRFRDILKDNVWVTRGSDPCLRLYTPERYDEMLENDIAGTDNRFIAKDSFLRRRVLAAQDLEIDKQGRIVLPSLMREWAGLFRHSVLLGQYHYIEIWAEDRYKSCLIADEAEFKAASGRPDKEKELSNGGDCSHSGTAGGNIALSGAEGQG